MILWTYKTQSRKYMVVHGNNYVLHISSQLKFFFIDRLNSVFVCSSTGATISEVAKQCKGSPLQFHKECSSRMQVVLVRECALCAIGRSHSICRDCTDTKICDRAIFFCDVVQCAAAAGKWKRWARSRTTRLTWACAHHGAGDDKEEVCVIASLDGNWWWIKSGSNCELAWVMEWRTTNVCVFLQFISIGLTRHYLLNSNLSRLHV